VVLAACIHVTGVVQFAGEHQPDGDLTFDVKLDAPYRHITNESARIIRRGAIHVEVVCTELSGAGADPCANDSHPLQGPFPALGQHVWLEGRLVLDASHGYYTELHPLYRWGPLP
jgi:hypothetical protein